MKLLTVSSLPLIIIAVCFVDPSSAFDSNDLKQFSPSISDAKCHENKCHLQYGDIIRCQYYESQQRGLVNIFKQNLLKEFSSEQLKTVNQDELMQVIKENLKFELSLQQANMKNGKEILSSKRLGYNFAIVDSDEENSEVSGEQSSTKPTSTQAFHSRLIHYDSSQLDVDQSYSCCVSMKSYIMSPLIWKGQPLVYVNKTVEMSAPICTSLIFDSSKAPVTDISSKPDEMHEQAKTVENFLSAFKSYGNQRSHGKLEAYMPVLIILVAIAIAMSTSFALTIVFIELFCAKRQKQLSSQRNSNIVVDDELPYMDDATSKEINTYGTSVSLPSTIGEYLRQIESSPPQSTAQHLFARGQFLDVPPPPYCQVFLADNNESSADKASFNPKY